ncbi:restriction endonuclease subunit S [Escherichia coli]|uniref:restriction endonuclease subunit S n=1 Tax=Escherichia coli TaxID=562 RepID=UPI003F75B398
MSELSYLEKLMDGVEVEWLPLSKVFNLRNGYTPSKTKKEFWANGDIPWFRMDDIRENGRILGNSLQKISSCAVKGGKLFPENSILISTSATIGEHALITVPHLANQRFTCLALKESYADCFDIKFLFYYCFSLAEWCRKNTTMSSFASVDMDGFKKFLIPRPCPDNPEKSLAIQSEIVRILDKFTALTAELTAELNMRKKQYNYYRDQLLNLEGRENTREMRIGDIYDFQYGTGNTIPKSGGQYPVYGSNGIVGSHDKYNSEDSPVIGHIGAYAGIVNWGQGKHFVTYNGVICRHKSKEVLQKYAYYLLLLQDFGSKSNSASQPFVSYNILNAPIVLVPPLQEQARIVAILDKFDTLTNSITEGLPREIELRQKQYEYYRDLLFSFPKPETVSN